VVHGAKTSFEVVRIFWAAGSGRRAWRTTGTTRTTRRTTRRATRTTRTTGTSAHVLVVVGHVGGLQMRGIESYKVRWDGT
jgi:hypothetical protein